MGAMEEVDYWQHLMGTKQAFLHYKGCCSKALLKCIDNLPPLLMFKSPNIKENVTSIFPAYQQDHVCELLNTIDACQVFFDIVSSCFDYHPKKMPFYTFKAIRHVCFIDSELFPTLCFFGVFFVRLWTLIWPRTTWNWWWHTLLWW